MPQSSVNAIFNFLSFKIERIDLKMQPKLGYLLNNNFIKPENTDLKIRLRDAEKFNFEGQIRYVSGLSIKITIVDEATKETLLEGEFSISGIFSPVGNIEKNIEENFVKVNLPALLMPYLRAAMTNTLASAGFGTVLFPLVNIYDLAQNASTKLIDHTIQSPPQA